jgi:thiol:disulfide interchange protein DsbD
VAIYLISPLLPIVMQMLAWATLLIMGAVFLHAVDPLPPGAPGYRKLFKGLGLIALLAGIAYIVGALSGGHDMLQPLSGLRAGTAAAARAPEFRRVDSPAQLENAIHAANGKPVMLDFYADWCVSCKEMERYTFADPGVQARLDGMLKLQADVTRNLDEHKALLKQFGLFGPPGIIFFDRHGEELKGLRVIGFQSAAQFAATLDQAGR